MPPGVRGPVPRWKGTFWGEKGDGVWTTGKTSRGGTEDQRGRSISRVGCRNAEISRLREISRGLEGGKSGVV